MRIVERGTKPPKYPWIGTFHCGHCKSTMELNEEDVGEVLRYEGGDYQGESLEIKCPVCEEARYVSRHRRGAGGSVKAATFVSPYDHCVHQRVGRCAYCRELDRS